MILDNEIRDLGVMSADSGAPHFFAYGIISLFVTSVLLYIWNQLNSITSPETEH